MSNRSSDPNAILEAFKELSGDPSVKVGRKLFPANSSRRKILLKVISARRTLKEMGFARGSRRLCGNLLRRMKVLPPLVQGPQGLSSAPVTAQAISGGAVDLSDLAEMVEQANLAQPYIEHYKHTKTVASASYAEPEVNSVPISTSSTPVDLLKAIAFYLPQFHPIPENDRWWGQGFTEWTNVSKAISLFRGHYQPHLPGELGFYDLRLPEIQERQVELARQYGIHGFAFYFYWFAGKRLLERPLESFVKNPKIDFPFCIVWANENWTRRWDGLEENVLMAQSHTPETDLQFIQDLLPYLNHPNYIRIEGRPLIIIYRADLLPEPKATVHRWKEFCVKHGLPEPMVVLAQTFGIMDPEPFGFDAAVQFPPHNEHRGLANSRFERDNAITLLTAEYAGCVFSYPAMIYHKVVQDKLPEYPMFETVFPIWDNSARRMERGLTFAFSNPQLYKMWLKASCARALRSEHNRENVVFINAWNEWAEGAHLEPDRRYGYAYLQATREALQECEAEIREQAKEPQPAQPRPQGSALTLVCDLSYGKASGLADSLRSTKQDVYEVQRLVESKSGRFSLDDLAADQYQTLESIGDLKSYESVDIIAVVSDPVARNLRVFLENAHRVEPNIENRVAQNDVTEEEAQELFLEFVDHEAQSRWFEDLQEVTGIDLLAGDAMQPDKHYKVAGKGNVRVLVIRAENLLDEGAEALRAFYPGRQIGFQPTDSEPNASDCPLLDLLLKKPMPPSYLDFVYNKGRFARHFYTQEEIGAFWSRWGGATSTAHSAVRIGQWGHDRPT